MRKKRQKSHGDGVSTFGPQSPMGAVIARFLEIFLTSFESNTTGAPDHARSGRAIILDATPDQARCDGEISEPKVVALTTAALYKGDDSSTSI